ncbi:MAG: metalloprotease [Rhodobacteraceae bacterium]|nr:metalloprotease [Paracoccaceae bacterium]
MELFSATAICILTYFVLRGGWRARNKAFRMTLNFGSMVLALLFVAVAMYFVGPIGGLALTLIVVIHEFGHVAAFRVAGHEDATFRLVPLMGGVAISQRSPDSQLHDFYITLMGPAICLAPVILAVAVQPAAYELSHDLGDFFWYFATLGAALNFFNLLPLWPLDGGRCLRIIVYAIWPGLANFMTLGMSAAFAGFAVYLQNTPLFIIAAMGTFSALRQVEMVELKPITKWQALIALIAHLCTAGAFLLAGLGVVAQFL